MPEAQAEILAEEQVQLIDERLATKRDLKELETTLRSDIELLKRDMTIRLGGMLAASIAIGAALVKVL
ncbi:MAG: DUF1640 domain-containing protein [Pseudomonadota bacterium]